MMKNKPLFALPLFLLVLLAALPASAAAPSIAETVDKFAFCWFCPIFTGIFEGASAAAAAAYAKARSGAETMLWIGWALWLAVHVGKNVGSVAPISPAEFFQAITIRTFIVFLMYALIKADSQEVFDLILTPVLTAAVDIGTGLLGSGGACTTSVVSGMSEISGSGALPAETGNALYCLLEEINDKLAQAIGYGFLMVLISFLDLKLWVIPDIPMLIAGIIIIYSFFRMIMSVPFQFVDGIVRLGMVMILFPFFIVTWAFPWSRSFAKAGWSMLLNSAMLLICMCLLIGMIIHMVEASINPTAPIGAAMETAKINNSPAELIEIFDLQSPSVFQLFVVAWIGRLTVEAVPAFADHFAQTGTASMSSMPKVGQALGGFQRNLRHAASDAAYNLRSGKRLTFGAQGFKWRKSKDSLGYQQAERMNRRVTAGAFHKALNIDPALKAPDYMNKRNRLRNEGESISKKGEHRKDGLIGFDIKDKNGNITGTALMDTNGYNVGRINMKDGKKTDAIFLATNGTINGREFYDGDGAVTSKLSISANQVETKVYGSNGAMTDHLIQDKNRNPVMHETYYESGTTRSRFKATEGGMEMTKYDAEGNRLKDSIIDADGPEELARNVGEYQEYIRENAGRMQFHEHGNDLADLVKFNEDLALEASKEKEQQAKDETREKWKEFWRSDEGASVNDTSYETVTRTDQFGNTVQITRNKNEIEVSRRTIKVGEPEYRDVDGDGDLDRIDPNEQDSIWE